MATRQSPLLRLLCALALATPLACANAENDIGNLGVGGASGTTGGTGTGGAISGGSPTGGGSTTGGSSTSGGSATGGMAPITCVEPEIYCIGQCVLLGTDTNCSVCGDACLAGSSCTDDGAGAMVCSCSDPATTLCVDGCHDLTTDPTNCGACGAECGLGTCAAGVCACNEGAAPCDGATCVDVSSDPQQCGPSCAPCGTNETCETGVCACLAPFETCDTNCVNTANDPANCGSCGATCDETQGCADGTCVEVPCAPFVTRDEAGEVGTTESTCLRIWASGTVNGNCWFAEGRTLAINGAPLTDCSGFQAEPFDDGYVYFDVGAGGNTWDGFGIW